MKRQFLHADRPCFRGKANPSEDPQDLKQGSVRLRQMLRQYCAPLHIRKVKRNENIRLEKSRKLAITKDDFRVCWVRERVCGNLAIPSQEGEGYP